MVHQSTAKSNCILWIVWAFPTESQVPPMLWSEQNSLTVFALSDRRPTDKTKLHYAPFFNIYEDGKFVWER
jgi:hypothetical protein